MAGNFSNSSNFTQNGSPRCRQFGGDSLVYKTVTVAVYIAMSIVAIIGNSLLVRIIHKNPRMRTSFNYYIANMAVSDVLVQFFAIPRIVFDALFHVRRWLIPGTFGLILCKLVYYIQEVCTTVSIECLVLIAVDRLLAVVRPAKVRYTGRNMRLVVITSTWVIALLAASPFLHINFLYLHTDGYLYCTMSWGPNLPPDTHNTYMVITVVLYFVIPLAIITVIYSVIFFVVQRRRVPGSGETSDRRTFKPHQKARANVLKLAFSVVVVFFLSWLPFVVMVFLLMTDWNWRVPCGMYAYRFFALFMAYSNTMTNPLVYFMLSENYRQGLRKMFPWMSIKYKRNSLISSRTRSRARTWVTHQTDSGAEAEIGQITDRDATTVL